MNPAVVIHIYDHHPAAVDASQGACHADLKVVESVGATTTVLIERVLQQGLPLSPLEATMLALGLYDETGSFTYVSTTPRDLEAAAAVLRAGADLTVVADTLRQPLEPDTIACSTICCSTAPPITWKAAPCSCHQPPGALSRGVGRGGAEARRTQGA